MCVCGIFGIERSLIGSTSLGSESGQGDRTFAEQGDGCSFVINLDGRPNTSSSAADNKHITPDGPVDLPNSFRS